MSDKGSRRPRAPRPLQQVLYRVTTSFALKAGWSEATELFVLPDWLAFLNHGTQAFLYVFQVHELVEVKVL
jgi:hypothetical protein